MKTVNKSFESVAQNSVFRNGSKKIKITFKTKLRLDEFRGMLATVQLNIFIFLV